MDIEKSRAEFEAWAMTRQGLDVQRLGLGSYRSLATYNAWCAWQASRKALVVELPKAEDSPDIAYFEADVLDALCAVGITVKEPSQ